MFPMHYIFDNRDREKTESNLDNQRISRRRIQPDRFGYNEIIVDECQDLTQLEFEFLRKLVMKEFLDEDRFTCSHNWGRSEEILPAGDPLQT